MFISIFCFSCDIRLYFLGVPWLRLKEENLFKVFSVDFPQRNKQKVWEKSCEKYEWKTEVMKAEN